MGTRQLPGERRLRRGARVHRLEPSEFSWRRRTRIPPSYQQFLYRPAHEHDVTAEDVLMLQDQRWFRTTIPARAAASGQQDGIDLLTSLANSPVTARRLAGKLWNYFVSDLQPADPAFLDGVATIYQQSDTDMREQWCATSCARPGSPIRETSTRGMRGPRNSSPGRSRRSAGPGSPLTAPARRSRTWARRSSNLRTSRAGRPDARGSAPAQMLARMNFAATVAANQKFTLAKSFTAAERARPETVLAGMLKRLTPQPPLPPTRPTN